MSNDGQFRLVTVSVTVEVDYAVAKQFRYEPKEFNQDLQDFLRKQAEQFVGSAGQVVGMSRTLTDLD